MLLTLVLVCIGNRLNESVAGPKEPAVETPGFVARRGGICLKHATRLPELVDAVDDYAIIPFILGESSYGECGRGLGRSWRRCGTRRCSIGRALRCGADMRAMREPVLRAAMVGREVRTRDF